MCWKNMLLFVLCMVKGILCFVAYIKKMFFFLPNWSCINLFVPDGRCCYCGTCPILRVPGPVTIFLYWILVALVAMFSMHFCIYWCMYLILKVLWPLNSSSEFYQYTVGRFLKQMKNNLFKHLFTNNVFLCLLHIFPSPSLILSFWILPRVVYFCTSVF